MARTTGTKTIATNRSARRDYDVLETVEAGLVLKGSEVKSLRASHVQFADANVWITDGEAWLLGVRIQPWDTASGVFGHDPDRRRKLLLHRSEIERLRAKVAQDRLALVPLSLYFKDGRVKVEVALARGRRKADRREALAKRDAELEARRAMARSLSGKGGRGRR
jgi:SsrA-binding protein